MSRRPRGGGRAGRGGGRGGGGVAPPALEVPEQIPGLMAWFDSRTPEQMNASPETGISSWASRAGGLGAVQLVQPTAANRPLWVAAAAVFGGRPSVQFDGIDDFLDALTAGDWTFLHNNLGATVFTIERIDSTGPASQCVASTCLAGFSTIGISDLFASSQVILRICNGGGVNYQNINNVNSGPLLTRDLSRWRAGTYGGGVRAAHGSGASGSANDVAGQTASTAAPSNPLRIGRTQSNASPLKGHVPEIIIYNRVLSGPELGSLAAWAAAEYGVAV